MIYESLPVGDTVVSALLVELLALASRVVLPHLAHTTGRPSASEALLIGIYPGFLREILDNLDT
jgi:hypothetical protein